MDKVHKAAVEAEIDVAEAFGGRRTAASGSGTKDKGDVATPDEVIEVKYTEKKSYSLKLEDLLTIDKYAIISGKIPMLHLTFSNYPSWVVISQDQYLYLKDRITQLELDNDQLALEQIDLENAVLESNGDL